MGFLMKCLMSSHSQSQFTSSHDFPKLFSLVLDHPNGLFKKFQEFLVYFSTLIISLLIF